MKWNILIVAMAAGCVFGQGASPLSEKRPNIVMVLADDLGFSDLGCYGGEIDTPVLDSLSREGIRFKRFYNTAKCHSSRVSLLTGLWSKQAGGTSMKRAVPFVPLLKQSGYATAVSGKWHLEKNPLDWGFDRYFGHLSGATPYIEGNDSFRIDREPFNQFGKTADEFYTTRVFTDYAIQFLKDWEQNDSQPFFLYMAYNAPHSPLQAPKALVEKYRGRYMSGWEAVQLKRFQRQKELGLFDADVKLPPWPENHRKWDALTDREKSWEDLRMAVYAGMVESLDQNLGRLVNELKALGEWDNTLFIFCSDNGANPYERSDGLRNKPWEAGCGLRAGTEWAGVCNTPFRWYKQNNHEGGIVSPCIMTWPQGLKQQGWNETPGHLVDIMPTILDIASVDLPDEWNGRPSQSLVGMSLYPVLQGEIKVRTSPLYFNFWQNRALREGDMKAVSVRRGPWELYDLSKDPTELCDLSASKPEILRRLSEQWMQIATNLDQLQERYRGVLLNAPVPWGTKTGSVDQQGLGGTPAPDEQHPVWKIEPVVPLP